jgi:hypothetical protein
MAERSSISRVRLQFTVLVILCGALQSGIMLAHCFPLAVVVKDAFLSVVLLILLTQVLYQIQSNYHAAKPLNFTSFTIVFAFAAIYQLAFNGAFRLLDDDQWRVWILPTEPVRAIITFLFLYIASLFWWIRKNEISQEHIQNELLEKERALTNAELENIHQQLQPHFLFNSLNSISALTLLEPKEAHRMIQLLSSFLRGTLKKDVQQLVSLEEELQQLRRYLEIEKVRFGHRLTTEIVQSEGCEDARMPALLLQPVIENAIKYGLYGQLDAILISIRISCDSNLLRIAVSSPFDENHVSASSGKGFGLASIRRRLSLFFGQTDLLTTAKSDNIFTTTVLIPQR